MPTERIEGLETSRIAKIMTVAFEEFGAESYHKTSYNRIIQRCGCSKGTMYYYFKSKEDLFLTLLKAVGREFGYLAKSQPSAAGAEHFWRETKTKLSDITNRLSSKPLVASFIISLLSSENRRLTHPASGVIMQIDEKIEDYLITGQLSGAIRRDMPIDLLTELVWSVWDTVTGWSQKDRVGMSHEKWTEYLSDLLLRCLSEPTETQKIQGAIRQDQDPSSQSF